MKITGLQAREIIDSRGKKTVQVELELDGKFTVTGDAPSGKSRGKEEAHYKETSDALEIIANKVAPQIIGMEPNLENIDSFLLALDATRNFSGIGANVSLPISIATVRACALQEGRELYTHIGSYFNHSKFTVPVAFFNLINGGVHAKNNLSVQEFSIFFPHASGFNKQLKTCLLVIAELRQLLDQARAGTALGDEGGFAPHCELAQYGTEQALAWLEDAARAAGMKSKDFAFALDIAASQLYESTTDRYNIAGLTRSRTELISWYQVLASRWPIKFIEDGLREEDWVGWQELTRALSGKAQTVGDDLLVTNPEKIARAAREHAASAVLIKPNQIGLVSLTFKAIGLAQEHGLQVIISHRSGETCDSFIADLAVGAGAGYIKTGAPVQKERYAKYERLLAIEKLLTN